MENHERFKLRTALVDELMYWPLTRTRILFDSLSLSTAEYSDRTIDVEASIIGLDDDQLLEVAEIVYAENDEEVSPAEEQIETVWNEGAFKLFLTHSAKHKAFATEVARHLHAKGIHGFVAHDTMVEDQEWADQLQRHLKTMDALAVLCHPEVNESAWCQQEIGWVMGSGKPYYAVSLPAVPQAFAGLKQWKPATDAQAAAEMITEWVARRFDLSEMIADKILDRLAEARSYDGAWKILLELEGMALTSKQLGRLDQIYRDNDQVQGRNPTSAITRIYNKLGRPIPDTPK